MNHWNSKTALPDRVPKFVEIDEYHNDLYLKLVGTDVVVPHPVQAALDVTGTVFILDARSGSTKPNRYRHGSRIP